MTFIPYGRHDISDEDISAVVSVLKSDFLTQGPAIERFESCLADFLQTKHVIAVSNGTAGLHLAHLAAGIGVGDAVIVPAITFAATSNAVLYCGATPIFADIDPITGNICPSSVERCIALAKKAGLKVKALGPVHYAGSPCDMGPLVEIAKQHHLVIIEDACHALGAKYRLTKSDDFRQVGSSEFPAMAVFSFHPVKHVTTGEGGAIATNNPEFAHKLRCLRTHGITKNPAEFENSKRAKTDGVLNSWYHEMKYLGLNYRICDIQAALGESQMSRAPELIKRRRQIAKHYDEAFSSMPGVIPAPGDLQVSLHSYHLYPLRFDFESFGHSRESFMSSLRESGIGTQVHYIPVPWHPYYENNRKLWLADDLPQAQKFYEHVLSIPMYSKMTDLDVMRVVQAIKKLAQR